MHISGYHDQPRLVASSRVSAISFLEPSGRVRLSGCTHQPSPMAVGCRCFASLRWISLLPICWCRCYSNELATEKAAMTAGQKTLYQPGRLSTDDDDFSIFAWRSESKRTKHARSKGVCRARVSLTAEQCSGSAV